MRRLLQSDLDQVNTAGDIRSGRGGFPDDAHTTSYLRNWRYKYLVIDPLITLETTMPSIVSNPVALSL